MSARRFLSDGCTHHQTEIRAYTIRGDVAARGPGSSKLPRMRQITSTHARDGGRSDMYGQSVQTTEHVRRTGFQRRTHERINLLKCIRGPVSADRSPGVYNPADLFPRIFVPGDGFPADKNFLTAKKFIRWNPFQRIDPLVCTDSPDQSVRIHPPHAS